MVYRLYVEKKPEQTHEAQALYSDIKNLLNIASLTELRLFNRYDVENIDETLLENCKNTVFSEPQTDILTTELTKDEGALYFASEYLPGQFDMRADSAVQCIKLIDPHSNPTVRTAKVYALYGNLTDEEFEAVKKYVINPVESRLASMELPETLEVTYDIPTEVQTLDGFIDMDREALSQFVKTMGLAMDIDDITFCQGYFKEEGRNPTVTEIRMIDTYWSDHCRHTTFLTVIDKAEFDDPEIEAAYNRYIENKNQLGRSEKPVTLMDIATAAVRTLKKQGKLDKLDESEEINACTVKMKVTVEGEEQDWLLLFKNETHNHPTEIEPFGGAATCIGGAIRDPLSGRSYVYAAMRVTGAADPTVPFSETLKGKLPQRKIVTTAAAGYSSYGNQLGLATGQVVELYHPGYVAKRMEIGAVIAAAPAENVRRERPAPGDIVILLGGATGRDGCGGATGSSKSHTTESLSSCGAEVQKGNAPEERKLQRLFRSKEASTLIKRCNDFGAGGVSVAVGELADGLQINLNAVPKKYEGLDGTELAISESQERMAVVVEAKDAEEFIRLSLKENLRATPIAVVTEEKRLVMKWNDKVICDISRDFLNSNGASKHIGVKAAKAQDYEKKIEDTTLENAFSTLASDLNVCSKRGLSERFDSTIGAGTVLMPFGGTEQHTPIQAMVNKIPTEKGYTDNCSYMAWGYNPYISEKSPYHGAYLAVVESISKLIATGADFSDVYLTFQEYFEKPLKDAGRWGKPFSALLGAYNAQMDFGCGAIGGKDSMSGSFEDIDVPPTLVSFAVTTGKTNEVVSPEFKKAGNSIVLITPKYNGKLPDIESLKECFKQVTSLAREGKAKAIYTPTYGGVAEALMKMSFGNGIGVQLCPTVDNQTLFGYSYGSFVVEVEGDAQNIGRIIGTTTEDKAIVRGDEKVCLEKLLSVYENKLEGVYPCNVKGSEGEIPAYSFKAESYPAPAIKVAKPKVLIPVFPGTNCEYDTAKAAMRAGAETEIFVIGNLNGEMIDSSVERFAQAVEKSQIIFIPGGFSGGDEPDGSGKFITAFFRNPKISDAVNNLLYTRDGLVCGICNGFQALVKLGLVSTGQIVEPTADSPTLTFNTIGRHQSRIVRTRIASNKSPWLMMTEPGEIYSVPISHGEGRFFAPDHVLEELIKNGQVATQYVDLEGKPTFDIHYNPNNSVLAIEGICSPDGRVFGKMGHSERIDIDLYQNVPGNYDINLFKSAVKYFK